MSFLVLSGLLSNNTLKKIKLRPHFPQRIFAKQPVPVRLDLTNEKKFFPSYSLALASQIETPSTHNRPFLIKLAPQDNTSTVDHVEFPLRGEHKLPSYWIESSYPFGLIRKTKEIPSSQSAIIFPQLLEVWRPFQSDRRHFGDFLSGSSGGSTNPFGIRDFVSSDPARLIHWKSSAKTEKLKVKEFEKEKKRKVLLDVRLQVAKMSESLWREKALSAATSLLLFLFEDGFETNLRLNGELIPTQGRSYLDAYLTALALAKPPLEPVRSHYAREEDRIMIVTDESETRSPTPATLTWGRKELAEL